MRLRILAAVVALVLPSTALAAAGPGVVLHLAGRAVAIPPDKLPLPDVPAKDYTVRGAKGSHKAPHAGVSLAALFTSLGANLADSKFVRIRRPDGSYAYVTSSDAPILWVVGNEVTHFLRPVRDKKDQNAPDVFASGKGKPIVLYAHTGNLLVVTLKADKTNANTKQQLSFSASVANQKQGEQLSYKWHFGDGGEATGQSVQHAYDGSGRYNVFVIVTGSGDSAGSSDAVRVTIGKPPTGTTGGGGPTGGGNPATPSPPPVVNNTPQTPPAPLTSIPKITRDPSATTVSGILLASSHPVPTGSLLSPGSRVLVKTGSTPSLELPLAGAAVVLLLGLGAFLEGGGRIRIPKLWPR
jgi:hypothetical protein